MHNFMKTPNTIYHNATVTRERHNQLNGRKSTLAHAVEEVLHNLGWGAYVLDGDNVVRYNRKLLVNSYFIARCPISMLYSNE
jgi:adenylylsulfate kinase-like enzyme